MNIMITLCLGLLGAILMFSGDMLLYFNRDDYDDKEGVKAFISIMKKIPRKRLIVGGLIGPVSAFIYCIGFYHMVLIAKENFSLLAWILYSMSCMGIICGGAYHSHCAYLGLIFRHDNGAVSEELMNYLKVQAKLLYTLMIPASLGQMIILLLGMTRFPFYLAFFSPFAIMMITPLVGKLPKGWHMVVRGGWTNFVYIIYYAVCLFYVCFT